MHHRSTPIHLRNGGTSVVLDAPRTAARDRPLGRRPRRAQRRRARGIGTRRAPPASRAGSTSRHPHVPQESGGWLGTPGLAGHRADGRTSRPCSRPSSAGDAASATILARDDAARLEAAVELEVTDSGLFRQRITLRNLGAEPYSVVSLAPTFPVPSAADELLDTTGRHLASARRNVTTSRSARTCARAAAGGRAPTRACCWPPVVAASGSSGAWCTRSTRHGAATTACSPSAPHRRGVPRGGRAARTRRARRGRGVHDAVGDRLVGRRPDRAVEPVPPLDALAPAASAAPRPVTLHVGGRVLRPRPGEARGLRAARGIRRRRTLRARRRLVPRRHRRARRLVRRPEVWPDGLGRSSRPSARSAWSSASGSSPRW